MSRNLLRPVLPVVATVLLLTSCSSGSDDESPSADESSASSSPSSSPSSSSPSSSADEPESGTRTVTAESITFDVPEGYSDVDADDVADDTKNDAFAEVIDSLGLTQEQFAQYLQSVSLFLFSDEGPQDGFLDNINVIEQQGAVPEDAQIEDQFGQLGATVEGIEHVDSDLGDIADVDYTLPVQGKKVAGRAIIVPTDEGVATVTISAGERATADDLGDRVIDTVAEAS